MSFKQLRETCFFKTGRKGVVLEVIDMFQPNLFDNNKSIDNSIFNKNSKIRFTLIDARKTEGKGKALYYNLDPNEVLLLTYLLSDGIVPHFKRRVGAYNSLPSSKQIYIRNLVKVFGSIDFPRFDRSMNYKKKLEGTAVVFQKNINVGGNELLVRKFMLSYEEAMRSASKWKITIEEGKALKDTSKSSGLNIVKSGTYKTIDKTFLMLQVNEIVIPINEAAKRVIIGQTSFYPLMKKAEKDFTKRKFKNKDYEGKRIDEWNPQGKSIWEEVGNTKSINDKNKQENNENRKCDNCGVDIDDNIYNYSVKFYKKPLCFSCQNK